MRSTIPRSTGTTSQQMLRAHLSGRSAEEQRLIEFYARLSHDAPEPLRGLAAAMLADGNALHETVEKLLETWSDSVPANAPEEEAWHLHPHSPSTECFFSARRFLESERDEIRRLEDWVGEVESHRDAMFFALLLRLLELDAARHTAVLDFVRHTTDPVSLV